MPAMTWYNSTFHRYLQISIVEIKCINGNGHNTIVPVKNTDF